MAYDSTLPFDARAQAAEPERGDDFHRAERLVVLSGASAFGAVLGFAAALGIGRIDLWMVILGAAPFLVLSLHLAAETLRTALRKRAYGGAAAAVLHVAALLAWPMTSLFAPLSPSAFWLAPGVALGALFVLAYFWRGETRGVLRVSALGFLVMAVGAYQGSMLILS